MKRVIVLLAAVGFMANFGACKKSVNCSTPIIGKVMFYSSISTSVVPDSSVTLVKYKKGSKFSMLSEIYMNIHLSAIDFNKRMDFPDKGEDTYDYDWEITMHPSNKVYRISDISHLSSSSSTNECTNTVSYKINDSSITIPGNPYSSVPNYVSDIQIKYY